MAQNRAMARRRTSSDSAAIGCVVVGLLVLLVVAAVFQLVSQAAAVFFGILPWLLYGAVLVAVGVVVADRILRHQRGYELIRALRTLATRIYRRLRPPRRPVVIIPATGAGPYAGQPVPRPYIAPQLRFRVFQRDGYKCQYCGRTPQTGARLEIDHVIPVSQGGPTNIDNLITACFDCNRGKAARPVIDYP
jgi:HNH endonuclease